MADADPVDPVLGASDPEPPLVLVCPGCGRSLVLQDQALRFATADDTKALPPDQLKALRALRGAVTRARG